MKRKKLAALGLAVLMAFGTAACGSGSDSGSTKSDAAPAEDTAQDTGSSDASNAAPAEASGEKVKLQFYSWGDETAYLDPAVEAYNAQSEVAEVEVTYFPPTEYAEKILATFASGTEFDVLCVNGLSPYGEYKSKNTIQDISSYVEASGLDTSVYGEVFKTSNEDGLYGLPYRGAVWLMFANEALFEKAGVPFSQEQLTWDEYRDLAKQLTKDGTYGGLVGMDNFVLLQQLGGSVMDEDTSKIRQSLELWKALEDDGGHVPFAEKLELSQNAGSLFTSAPAEYVATFQNGTWGVASYNSKYETGEMPFQYRVMPMPVPEGAADYTAPSSINYLSIAKSCKHPAEAYDFIEWMCTEPGATIIAEHATLPAYSNADIEKIYLDAAKQPDDTLAKIVFSKNNVPDVIYDPNYSAVETILKEEQELYMIGEQDIDTTMSNFESRRAEVLGQ